VRRLCHFKQFLDAMTDPAWLAEAAEGRRAFAEVLAERASMRVPDEDHEAADHGPAWPGAGAQERDSVWQPPVAEIDPAPGVLEAARERAGNEAGD